MGKNGHKIEKKHVAAMTTYAVRHIPDTNEETLRKFLELVNLTGSLGWISEKQILEKMHFMTKHIPGTCHQSLLTLLELLTMYLPLEGEISLPSLIVVKAAPSLPNSGQSKRSITNGF